MSIVQTIKTRLFGEPERETEIGHIPKTVRDGSIPKFRMRKEVNAQGQIYLPADVRAIDFGSDVEPGDNLSLDVFSASYNWHDRYDCREIYVDVTVAKGNRITIPAEVRHELDIREGDEIAVHAYSRFENDE